MVLGKVCLYFVFVLRSVWNTENRKTHNHCYSWLTKIPTDFNSNLMFPYPPEKMLHIIIIIITRYSTTTLYIFLMFSLEIIWWGRSVMPFGTHCFVHCCISSTLCVPSWYCLINICFMIKWIIKLSCGEFKCPKSCPPRKSRSRDSSSNRSDFWAWGKIV